MIHPSVTDTADVNEFGAVRIPEEILRKLGAGVGDLISFVKDGDSIRLVVKKQNSIQEDQPKAATGLRKLCKIRNFSQSPFGGFISEESDGNFPSGRN